MVDVSHIQPALIATIVVVKELLESMRSEASLVVVRHAVRAMFVVVDSIDVDAEEAVFHVSMNTTQRFSTETRFILLSARRTYQEAIQLQSGTTSFH